MRLLPFSSSSSTPCILIGCDCTGGGNCKSTFRTRWLASGYWLSRGGRQDVLVDPKEVFRIVLRFHRRETCVVLAVGRLDAPLDLVVHHEIDVSSLEIKRMNRRPVGASPRL